MTKNEYLGELRASLNSLNSDERDAAVKYYEEFFEEAGDENEQHVIADLGAPKKLAESIIKEPLGNPGMVYSERGAEQPPEKVYSYNENKPQNQNDEKPAAKSDNTASVVAIVILVITCPIWGGVALGILGAAFGIIVAIISVLAVFILVGIALFIWGICCLISGGFVTGAGLIGAGLIMLSLGLLLLVPTVLLFGKGIPAICRGIGALFRKLFGKSRSND